jgi:hypothetical protein
MERETIFSYGENGLLEIDKNGRLYWNGEPIAIESLHLTKFQKIGATITVLSTAVIAAMAVMDYFWPNNMP